MWEIRPSRLQEAMDRAGLNQSQLALAVGLKQPSIGRLLSGETKTSRALHAIAHALSTSPEYLLGETEDPSPQLNEERNSFSALAKGTATEDLDLVAVQEIDLKFGMGATELEMPVTTQIRHFSREWLRQYTHANPEALYFAQGIGDSMAPTILDSDLLLIDSSDRTLRVSDKFWAVAFGHSGMVKRLRPMPDGSVKILSDNASVPDEIAYDGELHVLGRVVGIVRKM